MKNIAVLIDFTEGSKIAMEQALLLATQQNATLHAINIAESQDKVAQAEAELRKFLSTHPNEHVEVKIEVGVGALFTTVPLILRRIEPDLVVVCTHGVKGMFQHLFGAHILKLVQVIHYPSIVVQENNHVNFASLKKILFPLGPHPEYLTKVNTTCKMAKALGAEITFYEIDKPGLDGDPQLDINRKAAKEHFESQGISFVSVIEEMNFISAGFSRQTLEYAAANNFSLISLMASVSKNDLLFGSGDKESFLVNTQGIPVLCCNE